MTNKIKIQKKRYPWNVQDTSDFSQSEIELLCSIPTTLFALNSYEPEPVFVRGRCLYL